MQPKFVSLPHQKVAYYESSGAGPAILFIHGNSSSGQTFQHQLNSPLGETHRLIAVDLPGHGASDPAPSLDDYGMPGYAT
ncbi:MAG: alpha/beta fold hydrolase, partial [Anaerolineales bacterium]|nr:alpha/beta fold hydrolase [Anaerolineales bacterium]